MGTHRGRDTRDDASIAGRRVPRADTITLKSAHGAERKLCGHSAGRILKSAGRELTSVGVDYERVKR